MALTTHSKSCRVASRTGGGDVEASRELEAVLESTKELGGAGGSGCGSGRTAGRLVDDGLEGAPEGTALMSGISSFGRDNASATTFASPFR